ncbi:MAG: ATP-binding protein [Chloroflexota bacterium]|nr:ATP-binding protein [Chloroflexota bacterium]
MGLLLVLLLGLIDYLTGPELSVEIFYFVPVLLVSWLAGRGGGILVSIASAVAGFIADAVTGHSQLRSAVPYWNGAMELAVFVTVVQLTATLQHLRREEESNRAALLTRADELKTALLHAVSHDIRTPLASIKASVTSLLDSSVVWDKSRQNALLQGIDEECDRLDRLVSNLLDISRIEGGVVHLQRDWYSIQEVIHTVLRRLRPALASHLVEVDVPEDLPLVLLDFVRIDQVVTNLVENAARHTPPGTPVTISARMSRGVGEPSGRVPRPTSRAPSSPPPGSYLEVMVADKGLGVGPDDLSRLFDIFHIAGNKARTQSTGLGLSIARGMVQAHGGQIIAQSWPGYGFSVTFTLPLETGVRQVRGEQAQRAIGEIPLEASDASAPPPHSLPPPTGRVSPPPGASRVRRRAADGT